MCCLNWSTPYNAISSSIRIAGVNFRRPVCQNARPKKESAPAGPSMENGPSAAPQTPQEPLKTLATGSSRPAGEQSSGSSPIGGGGSSGGSGGSPPAYENRQSGSDGGGDQSSSSPKPGNSGGHNNPTARQASVQEIYDDLKVRDEILSGAYANAVMIGHGPHEFGSDFITNFYPHSAVSARVSGRWTDPSLVRKPKRNLGTDANSDAATTTRPTTSAASHQFF